MQRLPGTRIEGRSPAFALPDGLDSLSLLDDGSTQRVLAGDNGPVLPTTHDRRDGIVAVPLLILGDGVHMKAPGRVETISAVFDDVADRGRLRRRFPRLGVLNSAFAVVAGVSRPVLRRPRFDPLANPRRRRPTPHPRWDAGIDRH